MKIQRRKKKCSRGLTLIELTVVIAILLLLIGVSMYSVQGYKEWKLASEASAKLRQVYVAQKTYLAEHPAVLVNALTDADIIPYLPNDATALPTIEDLDGNQKSIKIDKSPPYIDGNYDPSKATDDNLWDVGE